MKKLLRNLITVFIIFIWTFSALPPDVFAATNDATVEVLGGGGGGGILANSGGGGGGGGEYRRCIETLSVQSYTVTVGVGGTIDTTGETDSTFSGTGITLTADGGNGTSGITAGTAGTGGVSTDCDTAEANFDGGTPGAGDGTADGGGGGGGGAGYGGKGGNGASSSTTVGGGGGEGAGEVAAGNNAGAAPAAGTGTAGADGGAGGNAAVGGAGSAGVPATYHIVGGGGGGGGDNGLRGGACGAPGAGSGGGEVTGAGNGCRGEVRIIYVDSEIAATGGTETTNGIYRIHTFTSSGTFQVTSVTVVTTPPTVQTDAESGVGNTFGTMNGQITATGGQNSTVRGFAWGTSSTLSGGDTSTTTETGDFGVAAFSQRVINLLSGRTYYFRAYATNPTGTGYGSIDNFVTTSSSLVSRILRLFSGSNLKLHEGRIRVIGQ